MIGESIHYYRKKEGMTQEQLARGICSISYLSKLENNKIEPSDEIVRLLCQRLGVNKEDLDRRDESLQDIFLEWCNEILNRNKIRASELKKELESIDDQIANPEFRKNYLLYNFGFLVLKNRLPEAKDELSRLKIHMKFLNPTQKYYYYQFLGIYYYLNNNLELSLEHLKKAKAIGEEFQINRPELSYQLALVYTRLFMIPFGISFAKDAIVLFDRDSNYLRSIDCKILLGINNIRLGNFREAETHLTSALKAAESYQRPDIKAIVLHNLGFLYSAMKNHKKALNFYLDSLKSKAKADTVRRVNTIYFLAREFSLMGDVENALKWLNEGLELAQNMKYYQIKLTALKILIEENESERYIEFLEKEAIPYFRLKKDRLQICQFAESLGRLYSKRQQYKKSSYYYLLANESRKKLMGMVVDL